MHRKLPRPTDARHARSRPAAARAKAPSWSRAFIAALEQLNQAPCGEAPEWGETIDEARARWAARRAEAAARAAVRAAEFRRLPVEELARRGAIAEEAAALLALEHRELVGIIRQNVCLEAVLRSTEARANGSEGRKITPEFLEQVLALANEGDPEKVIADKLSAGTRTVARATKLLRDAGRLVNVRRRRRTT